MMDLFYLELIECLIVQILNQNITFLFRRRESSIVLLLLYFTYAQSDESHPLACFVLTDEILWCTLVCKLGFRRLRERVV